MGIEGILKMSRTIYKRLMVPFLISCSIGLIYNIISILMISMNTLIIYPIESWIYANELFNLIYPIFCSIPFCWILYYEFENGYVNFVHTRINLKRYFQTHYICGMILAFSCIFFISFSGVIIALYFIKPAIVMESTDMLSNLFAGMQMNQPLIYGFLLSLWRGFIGVLMYTLGFLLAFLSEHLLVILAGPFIYSILENFVTAILGMPIFSISSSFDPNRMNYAAFSISPPEVTLLIGPAILIIICFFMYIHINKDALIRSKEKGANNNGAVPH